MVCDREPLKTIHYAEPIPGFAATPKTIFTSPQVPAWTLSTMSVQGSGSSDEEEPFITPRDAEILQQQHGNVKISNIKFVCRQRLPLNISPKDIMGKYYRTRSPEKPGKSSPKLSSGL